MFVSAAGASALARTRRPRGPSRARRSVKGGASMGLGLGRLRVVERLKDPNAIRISINGCCGTTARLRRASLPTTPDRPLVSFRVPASLLAITHTPDCRALTCQLLIAPPWIGSTACAVACYFGAQDPRVGYALALSWLLIFAASSGLSIPLWPREHHRGTSPWRACSGGSRSVASRPFVVTTYLPELLSL